MKHLDRKNTFFSLFFYKKSVWRGNPPYAWKTSLKSADYFVLMHRILNFKSFDALLVKRSVSETVRS